MIPQTNNILSPSLKNKNFCLKPPVKVDFKKASVPHTSFKERKNQQDNNLDDQPKVISDILTFNNQANKSPPCKKIKLMEHQPNNNNNNDNEINSVLSKHDVKFDICTYNNCVFYITPCTCKKENNL